MNLDNVTLVCVEGSLDINVINDSVKALLKIGRASCRERVLVSV